MLGGWKPNTLIAYNAGVKKFLKYKSTCSKNAFNLPASKDDILQFCFWAGKHDKPFPQDALPRVLILLCSSEWVDASQPMKERKGAVKLPHLLALVDLLAAGTKRDKTLRDLAIVAFWGLAHLAELTYQERIGLVDPIKSLLALDVAYTTSVGPTCPVAAIKRHMAATHHQSDALFSFGEGPKRRNITKGKAVCSFQAAFSQAGICGLSGHLFRVGGASLRHALGIPHAELCTIGRQIVSSSTCAPTLLKRKQRRCTG
ncbi:hypothetical protein PCASD_02515 [Puccinia coronata f. sp. avenae]|uniref:Tyr recombinase domain-containing protein n=1 Tax=Puccinia coronata f. sp. avenae TaxID=200324 RepID=A0A2N5VME1_9BASI|nr:hypothetical protein PCASD_02515 [Puccinia coronata f. sp. avenae]